MSIGDKNNIIKLMDFLKEESKVIKSLLSVINVKKIITVSEVGDKNLYNDFLEDIEEGFYGFCFDYYLKLYIETGKRPTSSVGVFYPELWGQAANWDWEAVETLLRTEVGSYVNERYLKVISLLENNSDNENISSGAISKTFLNMIKKVEDYFNPSIDKETLFNYPNKTNIKKEKVSPIEPLNKLIGMSHLKIDLQHMINLNRVQKMRAEKGFNTLEVSNHLVFTGNPGTGKTTVARILANIYKSIGILSKGHFVEVDRSGLVGAYVGQTALKTVEVIQKAKGGILFIDEAYSLVDDTYGREAIDTLLKLMEDYRDDLIVIVAGYCKEMEGFIKSNPGLESRFNKYFHFEDYTPEELVAIFISLAEDRQYTIQEGALEQIYKLFEDLYNNRKENFSNGRLVRNFFEKVVTRQANRIVMKSEISDKDFSEITEADIVGILV